MWRYLGAGEWFAGVPARDLTDDEGELYASLVDGWPGDLYSHVDDRPIGPIGPVVVDDGDSADGEDS